MKESNILTGEYSASQVAKAIGLKNHNVISVWVNRNLIKPDKVTNLSSKKKIYLFSFTNLMELAILKELGDLYLIKYEILNIIQKQELGSGEFKRAIEDGNGFVLISETLKKKRGKQSENGNKNTDHLVEEINVKVIKNSQDISEIAKNSKYTLVINVAEIKNRLIQKIEELEMSRWG
jgi:hypothetical protein